jgi:hypothetical protein
MRADIFRRQCLLSAGVGIAEYFALRAAYFGGPPPVSLAGGLAVLLIPFAAALAGERQGLGFLRTCAAVLVPAWALIGGYVFILESALLHVAAVMGRSKGFLADAGFLIKTIAAAGGAMSFILGAPAACGWAAGRRFFKTNGKCNKK